MSRRDLMIEAAKRGKYSKLYHHLAALRTGEWTTNFRALEQILGFQLPNSARLYRPWWANENSSGHSQAMSWMMAGWKTAGVDMEGETLTFQRMEEE